MNQQHRLGSTMIIAVTLASFGIACSDSTAPTPIVVSDTTTSTTMSSPLATNDMVSAMERAIQDEYHAEATYERVLADFGDVWPFVNIVHAEQRHSAAVAGLFLNRGLDVPASGWNLDNVVRFRSVPEACAAAAQAERDNISLYDKLLRVPLPRDVENVFTNNRRASLEGHLPAFESCSGS